MYISSTSCNRIAVDAHKWSLGSIGHHSVRHIDQKTVLFLVGCGTTQMGRINLQFVMGGHGAMVIDGT